MMRRLLPVLLVLCGLAAGAGVVPAQERDGVATASTLDGVFTAAQATRGEASFRSICANCHSVKQFTTPGLFRSWGGRPIRELFEMIRTLMPDDNPGGLDRQVYVDVLAYLLKANGYPAGRTELPAGDAALRQIRIELKPGPGGT